MGPRTPIIRWITKMLGKRKSFKLAGGRRGAALVEFALILPLLVLLVFGMIDFGLLLSDHLALNQTAREAARIYAVGGTPSVSNLADKFGLDPSKVQATITAPATPGAQVIVDLTYPHGMIIFGGTKNLKAEVVMRRE